MIVKYSQGMTSSELANQRALAGTEWGESEYFYTSQISESPTAWWVYQLSFPTLRLNVLKQKTRESVGRECSLDLTR